MERRVGDTIQWLLDDDDGDHPDQQAHRSGRPCAETRRYSSDYVRPRGGGEGTSGRDSLRYRMTHPDPTVSLETDENGRWRLTSRGNRESEGTISWNVFISSVGL